MTHILFYFFYNLLCNFLLYYQTNNPSSLKKRIVSTTTFLSTKLNFSFPFFHNFKAQKLRSLYFYLQQFYYDYKRHHIALSLTKWIAIRGFLQTISPSDWNKTFQNVYQYLKLYMHLILYKLEEVISNIQNLLDNKKTAPRNNNNASNKLKQCNKIYILLSKKIKLLKNGKIRNNRV